jgi:hypothetical protein
VKKFILILIASATAILASKHASAGGNPFPIIIAGAFAFFFALALINPPGRRNLSPDEKQHSLMESLGVALPPDAEFDMNEEKEDEEV